MNTQPSKPQSVPSLPSYATPTEASKRREVTKRSPHEIINPSRGIQPRRPIRWEVFRSYSVSTAASRCKARSPGPFRLFDLPPEIRDRIYQFASSRWTNSKLDLDRYCPATVLRASQIQPALLRASKRLRDEAGVYFFCLGVFDILVDRTNIHHFLNWFKSRGKLNRERLASNPQVTIRLVHNYAECRYECQGQRALGANSLYGVDLLRVTDLAAVYDCVITPVTLALGGWNFTSECPSMVYAWHEDRRPFRMSRRLTLGGSDGRPTTTVSLPTLVRMRTMLKGIFATLEDREVVLMDEHDRRGRWLQAEATGPGVYVTKSLGGERSNERSLRIHAIV